ncbi:hypothetical protein [Pelagerythrobacter sp.]|uniref:hypothetical protein n=1 Tax=Pelagerythrobacter sp. TaxID=2800702 RepID=UPI0035AFB895
MSWPEAIAFCALMLTVIVAAGIWLDAHSTKLKNRTKELELQVRMAEAKAGQTSDAEAARLEERVRVLERIATDRSPDLAAQIEQLRDLHEIDGRTVKENAR